MPAFILPRPGVQPLGLLIDFLNEARKCGTAQIVYIGDVSKDQTLPGVAPTLGHLLAAAKLEGETFTVMTRNGNGELLDEVPAKIERGEIIVVTLTVKNETLAPSVPS